MANTISKSVVVSLTLFIGIPSFSGNASADWQGTTWGMSLEEADKNFRIPHRKARDDELDNGTKLVFDKYMTGNIAFYIGKLHFKDGGLSEISMVLDGGTCDSLSEALQGIYGKPTSEKTNYLQKDKKTAGFIRDTEWIDQKNKNKITLTNSHVDSEWEFMCEIRYEPPTPVKLTPAPGGL